MSIPITPQRLAAVYEMLRQWPPFCRWGLPQAADVKFKVIRTRAYIAAWSIDGSRHRIEVSINGTGYFGTLCAAMGHEMKHMQQRIAKLETPNAEHNAEFIRGWRALCRRYGWDPEQFI